MCSLSPFLAGRGASDSLRGKIITYKKDVLNSFIVFHHSCVPLFRAQSPNLLCFHVNFAKYSDNQRSAVAIRRLLICGLTWFSQQMKISVVISLHLVIVVCQCVYEASYRTVHSEGAPPLFSCIFKHECVHSHSHAVKDSLALGQGIKTSPGQGSWSSAKQDSYKVVHGRPRHVCRDLKPLFLKLCLRFVRCSSWTVHRKSLFLAFLCPEPFNFSLSLTLLLSDSRFSSCVLKEIMCLIGLLGVFFKWVLTHPHGPRLLWILLCCGLSAAFFFLLQTPHFAKWARPVPVTQRTVTLHLNYMAKKFE